MPPPENVMSCWTESSFVQTTVEPTVTVIVAGENLKFWMWTASVATGVDMPVALVAVGPICIPAMPFPAAVLPPPPPPHAARTIAPAATNAPTRIGVNG
jgi:hypothetical protein